MKVLGTTLLLLVLLAYSSAWAQVPNQLHYQGYLINAVGEPVDCPDALQCAVPINMRFRLFDLENEGIMLWEELHTSVAVYGGHVHVTLGHDVPITGSLLQDSVWLGVAVNNLVDLEPRQQVLSAAYALRAETAEESIIATNATQLGGISAAEFVTGAHFSGDYDDLSNKPTLFSGDYADLSNTPALFSGSYTALSDRPPGLDDGDDDTQLSESEVEDYVTNAPVDLAGGSTMGGAPLATGGAVPPGGIIMWSGALSALPEGWVLCDGSNGTPDLTGRFIRGVATSTTEPGGTGGSDDQALTEAQLPSHSHGVTDPGHAHGTPWVHSSGPTQGLTGIVSASLHAYLTTTNSSTGISIQGAGSGQAFDNRPAYFALAFIMKE